MRIYQLISLLSLCLLMSQPAVAADSAEQNNANEQQGESLADFIQKNNGETPQTEGNSSSWLGNIVDKVAEKGAQAFSENEVQPVGKRSNAAVFDISGIMLRMDLPQVYEAMQKRGYRKTHEVLEIPNFIRWRYEEQCRNQGIIGFERISGCVNILARKNNHQYIQQMTFDNFYTRENIVIFLTSNFTGNKVYHIIYKTEAANITGSGPKAEYLRNLKVFDFWKKINQKYGVPDNKEQIVWGLGDKKPSLKAKTGQLELDDPMLLELDYTRMSREDQKFMNTAVYTF